MRKKELKPKQLKAIEHILSGTPLEVTARKIHVTHSTIHRWKKTEIFKTRLEKERNVLFEQGLEALKAGVEAAAKVLIRGLDSRNPTERRLAAKDILGFSLKVAQYQSLETRIEKLEEITRVG